MSKIEKNWFEWCTFAVASVLVAGVMGYLAYDAWRGPRKPPTLEVHLGQAERRAGHYAIPVTTFNRGHQTAEAVHVQVVLTKQDGSEERADFQVQFLPHQASRRGFVTFEADPSTAKRITARALGYQIP